VVCGELEYEANNLPRARLCLEQGLDLGQRSATVPVTLYALEILSRLELAMGQAETALSTIEKAKQMASPSIKTMWYDEILALEASLHLRLGNLAAAERWADQQTFCVAEAADSMHRYRYRAYARLLLAQDRLQQARAILANLARSAAKDDRQRDLLTIYLLQSLLEHKSGREQNALGLLEKALALAAPQDYVRAFLDESPAVIHLLPRVRHVAPDFVHTLTRHSAAAPPQPLIEPLSERELEILSLLAADLTSPQIAEACFIAVSTVRSHIKSIYRKLDVHSRHEAIERAQALKLL